MPRAGCSGEYWMSKRCMTLTRHAPRVRTGSVSRRWPRCRRSASRGVDDEFEVRQLPTDDRAAGDRPDPTRAHAHVEAGPRPVQCTLLTEPVQYGPVDAVEDAGLGPLAHP